MIISPKCPFLGILRDVDVQHLEPLSKIALRVGLGSLEITMNTDGAADLIGVLRRLADSRFKVGAGTVLDLESLNLAIKSGAQFIVTPVLNEDVIKSCVKKGIPVFPGALTPTEVYQAWQLGATMVKVFPASRFGPSYFKDIKGPLNETKLLAVGGVTADNAQAYLSCGANGLAFGGSIFKKEWLNNADYEAIENALQVLIDSI